MKILLKIILKIFYIPIITLSYVIAGGRLICYLTVGICWDHSKEVYEKMIIWLDDKFKKLQ
jgi:hypothetical protein